MQDQSKNDYVKLSLDSISKEKDQIRCYVRERELKIAWRPKMSRRGQKSFMYTAVKMYNQTKIMGKIVIDFFEEKLRAWRK